MGSTSKYYDGTKLLSLTDINGNKPEIIMCCGNRTGGKTTYFNRLLVNRFLKNKSKFCLLYRFSYETDDADKKFFKDIGELFFKDYIMESEKPVKGLTELFLVDKYTEEKESCGYAVALNTADNVKKYSHFFSDVESILMDEFQSETNHYCSDEISKFISVHTSMARGHGLQTRFLPVYMLSNSVSIINPYFTELGISERLREDTKFLRGDGFVLEQTYIESAANAIKNSGFNRAFKNSTYVGYASENIYLNDNMAFVEHPSGKSRYLGTVKYNGEEYGLKEFPEMGIIYCDNRPDKTYRYKIALTTADHNVNYVMLQRSSLFIYQMRTLFERGCFRFKNLKCKEVVMKLVSY